MDPRKMPKREESDSMDRVLDDMTGPQRAALFERLKKRHESGMI